ncbi:MAG: DUF2069 domain-containing protein [Gammaproteobacteria bacterium]|nr:DUF2069 domain-containing protein [Gammaproteobacteria bacterium]
MTSNTPEQINRIRLAWKITTVSYMCLLGMLLVWHFRILPVTGVTALAMSAPLILPLLVAGPGLFRGKTYTYKWMSLLIWIVFAHGCMEAWTHREYPTLAAVAALEPILSVTLFIGLVKFLKAQTAVATPSA